MTKITVDLDTLTTEQAERVCGFILTYVDPNINLATVREVLEAAYVPAPPAIDPAAAFGNVATGKISEAAPSVEIPQTPTTPAAVIVPPSGGVTLDKDGLPWDARIHASSKTKNADGTWRLKRGLAKDHLDKVTAELRQVMAIPAPAAGPRLVPPPPPPAQTTAAAPPPPPAPAPVSNEAEMRDKYIALFGRVSAAMSAGKLSQAQLDTCLTSIGIPGLPLLGARLDLVPQACALIDGVIAGASA